MHIPTLLSLSLTSLTLTTAAPLITTTQPRAAAGKSFTGIGQLRTLWNEGDHADLGCLTQSGQWTANNALCGTFTANQLTTSSVTTFTLATAAGGCRIVGGTFTCGGAGQGGEFGIWPWPNSIPGVDCLRWGQYGLMASFGNNPPGVGDAPEEIHMVSYSETGKYVWLTWKSVEG